MNRYVIVISTHKNKSMQNDWIFPDVMLKSLRGPTPSTFDKFWGCTCFSQCSCTTGMVACKDWPVTSGAKYFWSHLMNQLQVGILPFASSQSSVCSGKNLSQDITYLSKEFPHNYPQHWLTCCHLYIPWVGFKEMGLQPLFLTHILSR